MEELIRKNRKSRERSEERQDQPKVLDNGTVSSWHDGNHHVVRWLPNNLYSIYYSCSEQCATTIRYRTFNALYHSCSTAFSVLEESGQVYFSCTRIPGSLLFSFFYERDCSTLLPCLLASIQPRTSRSKFGSQITLLITYRASCRYCAAHAMQLCEDLGATCCLSR